MSTQAADVNTINLPRQQGHHRGERLNERDFALGEALADSVYDDFVMKSPAGSDFVTELSSYVEEVLGLPRSYRHGGSKWADFECLIDEELFQAVLRIVQAVPWPDRTAAEEIKRSCEKRKSERERYRRQRERQAVVPQQRDSRGRFISTEAA